jgi:NTE family protein
MAYVNDAALVFGGGGVTGVSWMVGVLAGLAEAGLDLAGDGPVIGTSAGSMVGAQLAAGLDMAQRYELQFAGTGNEVPPRIGPSQLAHWAWATVTSRDAQRFRARVGRMALAARTMDEGDRRAVIEARLGLREWPDRPLVVTAVDAESGEFTTFDRDSGVPLVDAVGASCAVPGIWPPVTIDGRRWIDGGVRSAANADLAAGHERVVVFAPITQGGGYLPTVAAQVAELRKRARVALVAPDAAARKAIGDNALDPARRPHAAKAGRAQAAAVLDEVAKVLKG